MNAYARRAAAGFRSPRVVAPPRGVPSGDWLFGMQRRRADFLALRRAWPNSTDMQCTAYGFARKNAMQRPGGFQVIDAVAERIAAQQKSREAEAAMLAAAQACVDQVDALKRTAVGIAA